MRIRKVAASVEDVRAERNELVLNSIRRAVIAAVLPNPWLGRSTRADLGPAVRHLAPQLGLLLTSYAQKILGPVENISGYGKGAIVGLDGEREHAAAFLHTPYFGNVIRERLCGSEYISFADSQATEGATLIIPVANKNRGGLRAYFDTVSLTVHDAPGPDEVVIALAVTTGPRPNARIGDRTTDPHVKLDQFGGHPLLEGSVP